MTIAILISAGIVCVLFAAFGAIMLIVRALSHPSDRAASPTSPTAPPPGQAAAARSNTPPASPAAPAPRLPYARVPHLLTPAEGDFFAALQAAAPAGYQLFAQVRLANLVQVERWARGDKSHWWRIQAKCVDFVLCESHTFVPRLIVELDDRSHDRADRQARDAFVDQALSAAGIPILHVRWQRHYDAGALAAQIAHHLGIAAPTPPIVPMSIAVPLPQSAFADSNGFWRPIVDGFAPAPDALPVGTTIKAGQPAAPRRRACGACQTELHENTKFCPSCGAVSAL
jgi:very-short-patch-repair endonuclease